MKKIVTVLLAGLLLAPLGACKPEAGGSSGGGGGGGGVGRVDFELELAAQTDRNIEARRVVDCSVTGYKGKEIIVVIDAKTGKHAPYHLVITDMRTPHVLKIHNPDKVTRIYVECTMHGNPGDAFFCEPRTSRHRMAPLFGSREFAEIHPPHFTATCWANINAAEAI